MVRLNATKHELLSKEILVKGEREQRNANTQHVHGLRRNRPLSDHEASPLRTAKDNPTPPKKQRSGNPERGRETLPGQLF